MTLVVPLSGDPPTVASGGLQVWVAVEVPTACVPKPRLVGLRLTTCACAVKNPKVRPKTSVKMNLPGNIFVIY